MRIQYIVALALMLFFSTQSSQAQVKLDNGQIFVDVNDESLDSLLAKVAELLDKEVNVDSEKILIEKIEKKIFEDFEELIKHALGDKPFLVQKNEQNWTVITKDSLSANQEVTFMYQAMYTSTSVLLKKLADLNIPVQATELAVRGAVLLKGNFDQVHEAIKLFELIDAPHQSVTVELLVVEYRHFDGYKWDINIQNGTSGQFSEVGYDPASLGAGMELTFDVTNIVDNSFKLNLQALVENSVAKIATNPHITVKNGGEAKIDITDDKYILLETATINGVTTTLQSLSTGITLNISPRLAADSTIHLQVKSTISEFIPTSVDGEYNIESSKINTDVDIKDGETLIIGGLIKEEKFNAQGGLPLLRRIPLIGYLFKGVQNTNDYIETVIYITAYGHDNKMDRGFMIDETLDFYQMQQDAKDREKAERQRRREDRNN